MTPIILRNRYTNRQTGGYGSSTDRYLLDYVDRASATTPLSNPQEVMAGTVRQEKVLDDAENDWNTYDDLYKVLDSDYAGRSFGNKGYVYSTKQIKDAAHKFQQLWNDGHSIQKFIISFDLRYLKQMRVVPADYEVVDRKKMAANYVDQLKLRHAINRSIQRYTQQANFSRPIWAGAIQFDTDNVHAHVVIADDIPLEKSRRMTKNGTDRGIVWVNEQHQLKRGIDETLAATRKYQFIHKQVQFQEELVRTKTMAVIQHEELLSKQLRLIRMMLPADKQQWHVQNKSAAMQQPQRMMNRLVENLCGSYGKLIGFDNAHKVIHQAAQTKQRLDGGATKQYEQMGLDGLKMAMGELIFNNMATAPTKERPRNKETMLKLVNTPLARTINQFKQYDQQHTQRANGFYELVQDYHQQYRDGKATMDSRVMQDLWLGELRHEMESADKYRYFTQAFNQLPAKNKDWQELQSYNHEVEQLKPHDFGPVISKLLLDKRYQKELDHPYAGEIPREALSRYLQCGLMSRNMRQWTQGFGNNHQEYQELFTLPSADSRTKYQNVQELQTWGQAVTWKLWQQGHLPAKAVLLSRDWHTPEVKTVPLEQHVLPEDFKQLQWREPTETPQRTLRQKDWLTKGKAVAEQEQTQREQRVLTADEYLRETHQNDRILVPVANRVQQSRQSLTQLEQAKTPVKRQESTAKQQQTVASQNEQQATASQQPQAAASSQQEQPHLILPGQHVPHQEPAKLYTSASGNDFVEVPQNNEALSQKIVTDIQELTNNQEQVAGLIEPD